MPERNRKGSPAGGTTDTLEGMKEKAQGFAAGAADAAGAAKGLVEEWTAAAADKAGDALQELGTELAKAVRRYPIQSVLVAAAVGFLLARATKD